MASAPPPPAALRHCTLFSRGCVQCYVAQFLLGVCAALPLLYKWRCEPPAVRRSVMQFAVDCSKQAAGNLTCHFANLAFATLVGDPEGRAGGGCDDAACVWYVVMLTIDCTAGVAMAFGLLQLLRRLADRVSWLPALRRYGFYGNPIDGRRFAAQIAAWEAITVLMKLTLGLIVWPSRGALLAAGTWLLTPVRCVNAIGGKLDLELYTVMLFLPVVLNAANFWCTDAFIKEQLDDEAAEAAKAAEEGEGGGDYGNNCTGYQGMGSPVASPAAFAAPAEEMPDERSNLLSAGRAGGAGAKPISARRISKSID